MLAVTEQNFPGPRRPRVECRGDVCRLDFPEPPDSRRPRRARQGKCGAGRPGPDRARTDEEGGISNHRAERLGRAEGRLEPSRKAGFFASCPEPERSGKILLRLHAPWTGRRNDDGQFGRISMRVLAGALASTPSGVCLAERIGTLVASEELPSPVGDFVRMESWSWAPGSPPELLDH